MVTYLHLSFLAALLVSLLQLPRASNPLFFVSVMRCPAMAEKFLTPPYNWHECCWFTLCFSFLETASLAPLNHFALSLPYSMFCNVIIAFLRHRKPTALKCCRWSWRITHSLLLALLFLLCLVFCSLLYCSSSLTCMFQRLLLIRGKDLGCIHIFETYITCIYIHVYMSQKKAQPDPC